MHSFVCVCVCLFVVCEDVVRSSVGPSLAVSLSLWYGSCGTGVSVVADVIVRCYVVTQHVKAASCDTQKKAGAGGSGEGAAKVHSHTVGLMEGGGEGGEGIT